MRSQGIKTVISNFFPLTLPEKQQIQKQAEVFPPISAMKRCTGNIFKQNELIIIQTSLEKTFSNDIQNVVITDLLPAGFEIENSRTNDIPGMEWIKDAYTPMTCDVRDDRINLFVNSENLRQNYYYSVRALSPGVYKMGPASV